MDLHLATPNDAPALVALAVAFRDHLQRAQPTQAAFAAGIGKLLQAPDTEFVLASDQGQPLGYVLLRFRHSMWADGLEATLEDLFVLPNRRQSGLGRRLVEFALDRARGRGCVTVCLDTNEHNQASTRIYQSLGFDAVSKRWGGRQIFYRLSLAAVAEDPRPCAPA